jgi:hypothetical protein
MRRIPNGEAGMQLLSVNLLVAKLEQALPGFVAA